MQLEKVRDGTGSGDDNVNVGTIVPSMSWYVSSSAHRIRLWQSPYAIYLSKDE